MRMLPTKAKESPHKYASIILPIHASSTVHVKIRAVRPGIIPFTLNCEDSHRPYKAMGNIINIMRKILKMMPSRILKLSPKLIGAKGLLGKW